MSTQTLPNPKRVAAGKRNRALRKAITKEGRERLRANAQLHQPWRYSTGPRTPVGKARCAANGKKRQKGARSMREVRREVAELRLLLHEMHDLREMALSGASGGPMSLPDS